MGPIVFTIEWITVFIVLSLLSYDLPRAYLCFRVFLFPVILTCSFDPAFNVYVSIQLTRRYQVCIWGLLIIQSCEDEILARGLFSPNTMKHGPF